MLGRARSIGYFVAMQSSPQHQLDVEVARATYWVRWHAQRRGISLDQLAVYSRLGRSSVVQMGERAPTLRTLASIAWYLEISVADLLKPIPDREQG